MEVDSLDCLLIWMEWCPSGLSLCLPLDILPSTIKSRISFLLAPAHPGASRKRAVNGCGRGCCYFLLNNFLR